MLKNRLPYFATRNLSLTLIVVVIYFIAARAGLLLSFKNMNATPIWPPAGIALVAVILFGYRIWPGIALGTFISSMVILITNKTCDVYTAIWVSILISIGNTLEAMLGVYLLKKSKENICSFKKVTHIFQYTVIVLIICLVSATFGTGAIYFAKIISVDQFPVVWSIWWLDGIAGGFIVTPLLLVWIAYFNTKERFSATTIKTILFYVLVFFVSGLIFGDWLPEASLFVRSYFILPLLLWAAFYFELRVVVTAITIASFVAIIGTSNGNGPFFSKSMAGSILSLQVYMVIVSICVLVLRAAINERKKLEIVLKNVNDELRNSIKKRNDELTNFQNRINAIFETLLKYTILDFSSKTPISANRDEIDAIASGLNALGEELKLSTLAQSKYANELEQTNLLLIDSEQQIQSIFDNAPDAVIVIDSSNKILKWNTQAETTFGWKASEVVGNTLDKFIFPVQSQELYSKEMVDFFKRDKDAVSNKNFEIEAVNKKGTAFPISLSISPVIMKGKYLFISFIRNVSEQKRTEKKIKELAAIVESSDDAIISKSLDGTILSWNKGAEVIYGYAAEEVIGKSISIITPPEQMDELIVIPEKLTHDEQIINIETERVKKGGNRIYVSLTASAIKNNAGAITAISLISRDITQSKKMEAQMLRMSEELKRSNTELEQFAYVASHDLQEPLRMVTSYLQLLEKRYKDKLDQDATDFIEFAVDGSNRMRTLINSLLDYSRINRVKPFEWIDVNLLINEVIKNLATLIKENNAIIKMNELPKIYGDHVLIDQLFQNLITNAIKFRKTQDPEIIISATEKKGECLFSVKDNGIGIQKEYSEKIFVIFQRLHSKEKYPGTGMGLAICKKIVERHGGKIWVESEMDKGSTFYFTIKTK